MSEKHSPAQQDDDILGGTLVFAGTRVPIHTFIDYLTAGDTIDDFLDDFPTVSREQVIDYLSAEQKGILQERLNLETTEMPSQPLKKRILGLGEGTIWMSDDFDDPLPDEFWFGDDA